MASILIKYFLIAVVTVPIFFAATLASAAETKTDPAKKEAAVPKLERIGGTFVVTSIKPAKDNGFRVIFTAKEGSPRFKTLILESSHVHMAIVEGASLRLSADVIEASGSSAEVSQVVLFVPGRAGDTPVWMLSRRAIEPVPPARLLEMHAPQNDYQVF